MRLTVWTQCTSAGRPALTCVIDLPVLADPVGDRLLLARPVGGIVTRRPTAAQPIAFLFLRVETYSWANSIRPHKCLEEDFVHGHSQKCDIFMSQVGTACDGGQDTSFLEAVAMNPTDSGPARAEVLGCISEPSRRESMKVALRAPALA